MGELSHGEILAKLIDQELDLERGRKTSFEQRGAWVVASSGTLVTLLFALVATITKADGFALPAVSRWSLTGALAFFVSAAVAAVSLNWPQKSSAASLDANSLKAYVSTPWATPGQNTAIEVVAVRADILEKLQRVNNRRAYLLVGALTAETVAIVAVAAGVLAVFF
ncbi:hypothetical protein [Paractinoplanes maris]|uniref:hypothetical protein n=1 Tax=Paractinoplanes maris TaxID=1734446 RepID=UPI002020A804|nr:hypothetical protein [Actinoplanes maris]